MKKIRVIILLIVFVGCAHIETEIEDITSPSTEQAFVFGKINFYKEGKPFKCETVLGKGYGCWLVILTPESNDAAIYHLSDDGAFVWNLPSGEYTIAGVDGLSLTGFGIAKSIWAKFTVPDEKENLYIGDLNIYVLGMSTIHKVDIIDNYDVAVENYKTKFPKALGPMRNGLMKSEVKIGKYDSNKYFCFKKEDWDWGVGCPSTGVKPLSPQQPSGSVFERFKKLFHRVDSLMPTFEWSPSSQVGITYDLVIFEANTYERDLMSTFPLLKFKNPKYIPGRIVSYHESLIDPMLSLTTQLKPASNYFWSVRLRKGNMVSNWSTHERGGFYFFFPRTVSFALDLFTFSTPDK